MKPKPGSLAEQCAALPDEIRAELFTSLSAAECAALLHEWRFWARPAQLPPAGDWFYWLIVAGRGFGKTRAGVEWIRMQVEGASPLNGPPGAPTRIGLVAQTANDARAVMVEGESGFLATARPGFRPVYEISRRRLVWPNGCQALLYSAEEPDQLRGPQHHLAWCDELAKWRRIDAAWQNLILGLRLGQRPRVLVTTTPRPIRLLKELMADPDAVVTRGATRDNASHLSPRFLAEVERRYGGTRLGRQELEGEILEDIEGALWSWAMIEAARCPTVPELARIVVAVDPPVTTGARADTCGIVVAGRAPGGDVYILADRSLQGASPAGWAARAVAAYEEFSADRLVAEVNNGGDLVEAVIRQIAPHASYRAVRASRGKIVRAEPVAALYEQGRVRHARPMPELEEQMCCFTGGGATAEGGSPDRLDALVWAVTDLVLAPTSEPKLRPLAG